MCAYCHVPKAADQGRCGLDTRHGPTHYGCVNLTARDLAVVQLVGRFSQLASTHVGEILFAARTGTPLDRALTRLVRHGYLRRVGRRSTDSAGSGGYVYELGKLGWAELGKPEGYRRKYGISNHTLKVADIYAEFVRAHRTGEVELIHWELEKPYSDARADLVVYLGRDGKRLDYCLEVDLGTERPHIIRRKLIAYWQAFTAFNDLPYVAFIVPDQYRKYEIERAIRGLPDDQQRLFSVHLFKEAVVELIEP